jgi:hypothetical protein
MKSLIVVGIHEDRYIDRNARRLHEYSRQSGIDSSRVDYPDLLKGSLPAVQSENVLVALFFPHKFWDEHCETPKDTQLYGTSRQSYEAFRQFWPDVESAIAKAYNGRNIEYLVNPANCFVDRDKVETTRILKEKKIPATEVIGSRDLGEILDAVSENRGVFIKCRYGAEGKGITILTKESWRTNYRADSGRLSNHGNHDRWVFSDITGNTRLISQLLDSEVIVEHEIVTPEITPGTKFDIRAYFVSGSVPHMFARINRRDKVITNFSQGARVEHDYAKVLRKSEIAAVKVTAVAAASALQARFIGIDCMFGEDGIAVVEAQMFTDFPDIHCFNMAEHLAGMLKKGAL